MIFSFKKLSETEKQAKSANREQARKALLSAKESAIKCLSLPEFNEYLKSLQDSQTQIMALFLAVENSDPATEWKLFKELQIELKQLQSLLKDTFAKANIQVKEDKKKSDIGVDSASD